MEKNTNIYDTNWVHYDNICYDVSNHTSFVSQILLLLHQLLKAIFHSQATYMSPTNHAPNVSSSHLYYTNQQWTYILELICRRNMPSIYQEHLWLPTKNPEYDMQISKVDHCATMSKTTCLLLVKDPNKSAFTFLNLKKAYFEHLHLKIWSSYANDGTGTENCGQKELLHAHIRHWWEKYNKSKLVNMLVWT